MQRDQVITELELMGQQSPFELLGRVMSWVALAGKRRASGIRITISRLGEVPDWEPDFAPPQLNLCHLKHARPVESSEKFQTLV